MKANQIISRSDAMYCGIAMAVTILELALIATNPQLGNHALEIALIVLAVGIEMLGPKLFRKIVS